MWQWLVSMFQIAKGGLTVRDNFRVYRTGGGWGNHVAFQPWVKDSPTQGIWGHKTPKPCDGDVLISPMASKRNAIFIIHDLDCPGDPPDMFFAKASFVGYEDEGTLKRIKGS